MQAIETRTLMSPPYFLIIAPGRDLQVVSQIPLAIQTRVLTCRHFARFQSAASFRLAPSRLDDLGHFMAHLGGGFGLDGSPTRT